VNAGSKVNAVAPVSDLDRSSVSLGRVRGCPSNHVQVEDRNAHVLASLVPLEYSIAWLICAITYGRGALMVGWPMPLKIIYLMVRLVAALAVLASRRDLAKEAELLVLPSSTALAG
jgi:hypothetical protein